MNIDLHFDELDWERIERDWTAWWAGKIDRPMVLIEGPSRPGWQIWQEFVPSAFDLGTDLDTVLDYYQDRLEARNYYGDAFPKWWLNFGPGILAGFLGARVHPVWDTVWFEPAESKSISDLRFEYDDQNPWWRWVMDLTRRAVERWGSQVAVGHTDLGGNLDVLASFRTTQQLLVDVLDAPEEVDRLAGEITRLWRRYYDEQYEAICRAGRGTTPWAAIWSPQRCYMFQSDFSYMISPRMFERFVLPDLAALCGAMEHGFYHLDGKGQIPHLDHLLSLERLRGIQWIPGDGSPPPEEWLPLLKRIRDGGKLCQVFVTAEGARKIVRALGGKGFALSIQDWMSPAEAEGFLKEIQ